MLLQTLTEIFYKWEVQIGVIVSMLIQIILVLFGSRRKASDATWLKILVWGAYVSADAVAIFSLGLLTQNRGDSSKVKPLQNHQLHLLWVPFLILHLGGPDTITAYSLEDNNLWLRHLLSLVIQVGVSWYAVIKSWNNHNPLTYLVIPIFISGVIKYCERTWALKSASLQQINDSFNYMWADKDKDTEVKGGYFDEVYQNLSILTYFFADELLPLRKGINDRGNTILNKTSSEAFRLVEDELGLMYDLLYTKASLVYSLLGICIRCVYVVSSVATLTSFAIIRKHKHNEANWSYPLSDVLITYFLMTVSVILDTCAVLLVVLSDWALIWLERHQNNNGFAKFLFQKISTYRRVLLSEKRWSRSIKQHNILQSQTRNTLKRTKDCFFNLTPFSLLVPSGWKKKQFQFEIVSEAGDDAEQTMREEVWKVIKDWFHVSDRRPIHMGLPEFMAKSSGGVKGLWERTDGGDEFGTSLFAWYIVTTLFRTYCDDNIEQLVGSNSNLYNAYKASKHISDYLMYLARFHQDMLPPGDYKHTYEQVVGRLLDKSKEDIHLHLEDKMQMRKAGWERLKKKDLAEPVDKLAESLIDNFGVRDLGNNRYGIQPSLDGVVAIRWVIISEVWAHLLVYAAASQDKWVEHAQQLGRGGEFITHVAVLIAHASTSKMKVS